MYKLPGDNTEVVLPKALAEALLNYLAVPQQHDYFQIQPLMDGITKSNEATPAYVKSLQGPHVTGVTEDAKDKPVEVK